MWEKKFSVGLNLGDDEAAICDFIDRYAALLSSVYFSPPLGRAFYSRKKLADEYDAPGSHEKLLRLLDRLKARGVRREIAINHSEITEGDLDRAIAYMRENIPDVEEIVCLAPFAKQLREAFPNAEMKYSYNNMRVVMDATFDTYVVGKWYLRDKKARHDIIDSGYGLVLLLNNGCSFNCRAAHCNKTDCQWVFEANLRNHSISALYALQSFFPSELARLMRMDEYAGKYRFKISNRPSSVALTSAMLDAYTGLRSEEEWLNSTRNLCLFGALGLLTQRHAEMNLDEIRAEKRALMANENG